MIEGIVVLLFFWLLIQVLFTKQLEGEAQTSKLYQPYWVFCLPTLYCHFLPPHQYRWFKRCLQQEVPSASTSRQRAKQEMNVTKSIDFGVRNLFLHKLHFLMQFGEHQVIVDFAPPRPPICYLCVLLRLDRIYYKYLEKRSCPHFGCECLY